MSNYCAIAYSNSELSHHGIKGMKWGVRRYQHKDGTRASLGKKHEQQLDNGSTQTSRRAISDLKNSPEFKAEKDARRKKIMIGAAVVAGTALAAYGTYKLSKGNYLKYTELGKNSLKSSIKNYNLADISAQKLKNNLAKKRFLEDIFDSYRDRVWRGSDQLRYLHKDNARNVADAVGYIKKGDSDYAKAASYYDKAAKTIYSRIKNKKN